MPATLTEVHVVRIICDIILKEGLLAHLKELGASGWTWWPANGKGEHPTEAGLFNESTRLYVEVWCDDDVADKIIEYCNSGHFAEIGMSVGVSPLWVSPEQSAALSKH